MKTIYGNQTLLASLGNMALRKRSPQSIIFCGDKGCGKKTIAAYYAAQLMCSDLTETGAPCGKCRNCKLVFSGTHPDITYVPTSGKSETYSVKTIRAVKQDAFVRPNNNSDIKVYIMADCQNLSQEVQNTMLKIIEEPPEYCCFIFTAVNRYEFLPTILSRCVTFSVMPCTEQEAAAALAEENDFSPDEIRQAVGCFHGNIGLCTQYVVDESLRKKVDLTKRLADSIIRKDEYRLNADVYSIGSGKDDLRTVMSMLDNLVRDCAVLSEMSEPKLTGCCHDAAKRLSGIISPGQASSIHYAARDAWNAIERNVSAPVVMAALCADIISIIS